MPNPFALQPHDLTIKPIAPGSPTDPRVPMAEEQAADREMSILRWCSSRQNGWAAIPKYAPEGMKLKLSGGKVLFKVHPEVVNLDTQIVVPPLENSTLFIKRDDILSLVAFAAEVGESQDPVLGQVGFHYHLQSNNSIQTIEKENSRRYRAFWMLVLTQSVPQPADIINALSAEPNGDRRIAIANTLDTGFALSPSLRIFGKDPNLVPAVPYVVLTKTIEVLPLFAIRRIQNLEEGGYTYGTGGEEPLSETTISLLAEPLQKGDIPTQVRQRFMEVCAGIPGRGSSLKRTVQNLTAGQVSGNPGRAGTPAASPNGSVCLANDQRVSFTNQAVTQVLGVTVTTAGNNGSGKALVATGLNTNAPAGTTFSDDRSQHKIYSADGTEQSALGTFSNLGGTGSLQWVAGENSTIKPGNLIFFVPAIRYSAGSGLSIPFRAAERVWINGAAISPGNIRHGGVNDLDSYQDPVNGETFIVVTGSERAAIHYIYKAITINSDAAGTLTIPSAGNVEKGCFAFIQGVSGRIDKPVYQKLQPNTAYKALVYYPPRSLESWQFQLLYSEYQGRSLREPDFLDGATIISPPVLVAHTQGGGLSVHRGDALLQKTCVSMHLPRIVNPQVDTYEFDAPIQLPGEPYMGPIVFRELPMMSAPGLVFPAPGQVLNLQKGSGVEDRSVNAALQVGGQTLGWRSPLLNSKTPFQTAVAFAVRKGEERRLVIVTKNCSGVNYENIQADPRLDTAIDLFMI